MNARKKKKKIRARREKNYRKCQSNENGTDSGAKWRPLALFSKLHSRKIIISQHTHTHTCIYRKDDANRIKAVFCGFYSPGPSHYTEGESDKAEHYPQQRREERGYRMLRFLMPMIRATATKMQGCVIHVILHSS